MNEKKHPRNPYPTVDIVIYNDNEEIVLVKRKNPPYGWALPGGFVDYGESCEDAACREAFEETGLQVKLDVLLGVYSRPDRDPRFHTLSVVYTAKTLSPVKPVGGDDALEAKFFPLKNLPLPIVFDHEIIIKDFYSALLSGQLGAFRSVAVG